MLSRVISKFLPKQIERTFPSFIIVGAQKGGTSSLYYYLSQHPELSMSTVKEVHYFDINYLKGPNWYKKHFIRKDGCLAGEASPYYLFHPYVPGRISRDLPTVKIIALLRNPVDRAFSHYRHCVKQGIEKLTFEEAITLESERMKHGKKALQLNPFSYSLEHQHYSYLERGKYALQLQRWYKVLPKEQLLVLRSEDFFINPQNTLKIVYEFLAVKQVYPTDLSPQNPGTAGEIPQELLDFLRQYFKSYNEDLAQLLNQELNWDVDS
ncbi:sulfotransferase [Pedobacter sp. SYSU D00535]|uniref:sulfotransferase family protein n=1 Tax=Pedobacter sp. SYSU D00535 TaxID=2810308 RepID=UPI001A96C43F|nr:sulfotransferase [Pedobacter sp. SYSU D00535]